MKDEAYKQAEQKIQQALQSGATELDLRSMKLTELPESIGQLKQLRKLDLGWDYDKKAEDKNQLTTLPPSLGQLTQLTELNLSNNQLTTLPESLGQLTQLTELILISNQLTTLPDSARKLIALEKLNLCNNKITNLPAWLSELTNICWLALGEGAGGNPLGELPESIRHLKNVTEFWAADCGLNLIPDWIGELTNLKILKVFKNKLLKEIPSAIGNLKKPRRTHTYTKLYISSYASNHKSY